METWAADTPISTPLPPENGAPVLVPLGEAGFGFTMNGLVHDITEAIIEDMFIPAFAPPDYLISQALSDEDWDNG